MHGPTGNITVLSTYGRKYGENKWSKLHSYFFWKQFKLMILNFFCPVYIKFIAHEPFLEQYASGTIIVKMIEDPINLKVLKSNKTNRHILQTPDIQFCLVQ
jgi:hypothetical protein